MNRADQDTKATGWRGSSEVWLAAAYDILVRRGVAHIKISTLAAELGLARTSFYWHFTDRAALLDALVAQWQDKNTGNLVRQSELYAETIGEAVLNVCDCWMSHELFDASLDFAIRNWAQSAPALKAQVMTADAARIEALLSMFARHGLDTSEAHARARTMYTSSTPKPESSRVL